MKFYWKYVKPHIKYFIIGPILMMAEVVGEVVLPYLFSRLINNGIPNGNTGYIIGNDYFYADDDDRRFRRQLF